jgi:hypothetical protein
MLPMRSSDRKLHHKRWEIQLDGGNDPCVYVYPVLLPGVPFRCASVPAHNYVLGIYAIFAVTFWLYPGSDLPDELIGCGS